MTDTLDFFFLEKDARAVQLVEKACNETFTEPSFQMSIGNLLGNYSLLNKVREEDHIRDANYALFPQYEIVRHFEDSVGSEIEVLQVALQPKRGGVATCSVNIGGFPRFAQTLYVSII